MTGLRAALAAAVVLLAAGCAGGGPSSPPSGDGADPAAAGPLRVLPSNPRYFTDGSGKAVYLTGSHVWWSLVGGKTWKLPPCTNPVKEFSYSGYLDQLESYGHNFFRLWAIELPQWVECGETVTVAPQPWLRTGPDSALDGKPKFDLSRPDPAYYERLRERVEQAAARGIYVSVMLFEGWGLRLHGDWRWRSHPFNAANNVNGVDGDPNADGTGTEIHTLGVPAATAVQEDYVRRVVDTVNGLDNVLFEVSNESGADSIDWQYRMIDVVKAHEQQKGKQHPVGMTFVSGAAPETLLASRADWVSPGSPEFVTDPPAGEGTKVVLSDTDHHCGGCGDSTFPWRAFTRGLNPIHMDFMEPDDERSYGIRATMGQTRKYANRIDLARSQPRPELASTGYCLAVPGREYVAYQPESGPFTVDLSGQQGSYSVEWFEVAQDRTTTAASVPGGGVVTLHPPFAGQAVAYLRRL